MIRVASSQHPVEKIDYVDTNAKGQEQVGPAGLSLYGGDERKE
ncbi:MAG: hypothetical protein RMI90_12055 [Thermoguttaceae bacterium]|nr:hypothetical protein [Thermoguttaceae bacterium]